MGSRIPRGVGGVGGVRVGSWSFGATSCVGFVGSGIGGDFAPVGVVLISGAIVLALKFLILNSNRFLRRSLG